MLSWILSWSSSKIMRISSYVILWIFVLTAKTDWNGTVSELKKGKGQSEECPSVFIALHFSYLDLKVFLLCFSSSSKSVLLVVSIEDQKDFSISSPALKDRFKKGDTAHP